MGRLIALMLLVLVAAPAAAAPSRVASLGICTDELVLMLARPGQVASVSFLAHDPLETPLAARAAGLHRNNGSLGSVIALKPDLVVTGGAVNRFARELAAHTGTRVLDVPPPTNLADLRTNIRLLADALGTRGRGEALVAWIDARLGSVPRAPRPALMVVAGGLTPQPHSIAAEMLMHAGYTGAGRSGGKVSMETLAANPALPIIVSNYRARQFSLAHEWLRTAVSSRKGRVMRIDGRLWTCPGPLAAIDVARLRAASGR